MSNLISGKEALIALANGEEVQHINKGIVNEPRYQNSWAGCETIEIRDFGDDSLWAFRLKPRTITINAEIEKPKEIVLCAITGAVGLVYGDIDKAKSAKEKLEVAFNAN